MLLRLLLRRIHRTTLGLLGAEGVRRRDADGQGVGELEVDEALGGDLNLFTAGDGVGSGAEAAAGCSADGCAFTATDEAAKDGAYGCSATNFGCRVSAAAFALNAVGVGGDGEGVAVTIDADELNGEQGVAFVVGGLLYGGDSAG